MKIRYYLLIGIVSYLLFTLINTPAATVLSLVENQVSLPVKFYGVQGTIWQGQTDRLMMQGGPPIDNLRWKLQPSALLTASIAADVQAQLKQQNMIGHVQVNSSGDIEASDLRARLEASVIQQLAAIPFGQLDGVFNIDIASLQASQQSMPRAEGRISWKNAKLTMMETVDLGEVLFELKPGKQDSLDIVVGNKGGDISISGQANVMNNKRYTVDISFTPQRSASANVTQSLGMFARRQSNGSYRFKQSGSLQQLGL